MIYHSYIDGPLTIHGHLTVDEVNELHITKVEKLEVEGLFEADDTATIDGQ